MVATLRVSRGHERILLQTKNNKSRKKISGLEQNHQLRVRLSSKTELEQKSILRIQTLHKNDF